MRSALTPKQVARAIGVSEASLKRWCDKGLLVSTRTVGGHRRLPLSGVIAFLRQSQRPIVRPEVLGLPASTGTGETVIARAQPMAQQALETGDRDQLRRVVFDLYLAGHSVATICDRIIAHSFHNIGDRWQHRELEIFEERRACEVCVQILHEWSSYLPTPAQGAPVAFGGTLSPDPYQIPTTMVSLVLRELGWAAESYGTLLPAPTLVSAIHRGQPRLFWLSVSYVASPEAFVSDYATLFDAASAEGSALVVGGQALTPALRDQMQYSAYCDNLHHLVAFAQTLYGRRRHNGNLTNSEQQIADTATAG